MQSMLLSIPFNRPVLGVIVSVLFWVISYTTPIFFVDPKTNVKVDIKATDTARTFLCLLPNIALHFTFRMISEKEVRTTGNNFANLFEQFHIFGSLSQGLILIMMLMFSIICGILIWYLDAVWPWQFGVPKPFYFPFLPSYWCPKRAKQSKNIDYSRRNSKFFERQMSCFETAISIANLRKEFSVGFTKKVAITDASLEINRNQITVLLGHNGAGKTTMMNVITGIFPPSSGSVTIDGYDVVTNSKDARRSISLCPQHNVIYNELTVREHLKLFSAIKGTQWSSINGEVQKVTNQLNLFDKSNTAAQNLSGGMKRKLCLGIALIGDTKIVILDEPTSGMDPDARRTVWDLLQSVRHEKTILITTHFMEEADALADRIAIMAEGEVKCFGTPMFLKRVFGNGYQLRIAKSAHFQENNLTSFISKFFPNATISSDVESEIVYRLESGETSVETTKNFPNFFEALERAKNDFGIASFGLSVTTIEDVFLGVSSNAQKSENGDSNSVSTLLIDQAGAESRLNLADVVPKKYSGFKLILQQLKALLLKRVNFSKRYLPMFIFQLIIPLLLFCFALYMDNNLSKSSKTSSPLRFDLYGMYGSTKTFYQSYTDTDDDNFRKYYIYEAKRSNAFVENISSSVNVQEHFFKILKNLSPNEYIKSYIVGASIESDQSSRAYNVYFNIDALHSLPISINMLYNALLNEMTQYQTNYSINVESFVLPDKNNFVFTALANILARRVLWLSIVPITIPFLAASYLLFPINDRVSKAKLLQLMTGVHPVLFWMVNFFFDFLSHSLCSLLILAVFAALDVNRIFIDNLHSLLILLLLFGISCIPMDYAFSFLFNKSSTGFTVIVVILLVTGSILSPIDTVLSFVLTREKYDIYQWIVRISPSMSFTKAFLKLYDNGLQAQIDRQTACNNENKDLFIVMCQKLEIPLQQCCSDTNKQYKNPFKWGKEGILEEVVMFLAVSAFFTLITILCELNTSMIIEFLKKKFCRNSKTENDFQLINVEDADVCKERQRVAHLLQYPEASSDLLLVSRLSKKFQNFHAVKNLTFGIHNHECFGLLGVNGAGKTTTFRMLVGDLLPTSGNAYCEEFNLKKSLRSYRQNIGYCPQFDALLSKLTGREMLNLFGRLRGIKEQSLKSAVNDLIFMCDLQQHVDKRTESYSGGTRRKLSLAMALIGSPKLLFLDEPSSGVDPGSRRKLWETLRYVREYYGCSIVLTSHNMDECEALCGRISIMVSGELKCIGNFQHLRQKFAQGYTLKIKAKREQLKPDYIEALKMHLSTRIPSAKLKYTNETIFEYHITDASLRWSSLFKIMERTKATYNLEDYTLSDTTLEQIFISFARQVTL
ncbi:ATP-binding cassette sub-family A member 1-like protein [Dinothrombium tinctorium]|nr:ATP-binding cassette sub-family A member 1-like protein [Dinothrombium tinctorium]